MIVRNDIIQGTEEWFAIKWGKIGGSRCEGLYNKTDTLLVHLIAEHSEDFELEEDGWMSSDMVRGIELEPEARRQLSEYIGQELITAGWWQSKDHPLLGVSPDGFTSDLKIACEIKCPARNKHTKTILEDAIPADNILQCVHYFVVNPELEKLYFCSFRPESVKPLFVKCLTRESKVDIGWKIKGKITEDRGYGLKEYVHDYPDLKTIDELCEIARNNSDALSYRIKTEIEHLKF